MKFISNFTLVLFIAFFIFSCKPSGEKAETGEAGVVAEETGVLYTVNTESSAIMWEGAKVTGKHNGDLKIKSGEISMADGELTGGSFVLDMTTINVMDLEGGKKAGLEGHLKGTGEEEKKDHFFNVNQYPEGKFEITKVTKLMNDQDANYIVKGNLTLKDHTKEIRFRSKVTRENDMVSVMTPAFTIDRTEWGINYGSASLSDGLKDKAINDEIGLQVKLFAKK